jgi:hypothetical protein
MLVVHCVGKSRGLALFWEDDIGVEIQNYSSRHINAKICLTPNGGMWNFTSFYGHSDASKRKEARSLLQHLASLDPGPWMCMGDFNEILHRFEKCGGNDRQQGLMEDFKSTLAF